MMHVLALGCRHILRGFHFGSAQTIVHAAYFYLTKAKC